MTLTLLHTAQAHVATFAALRDRIAPGAALVQAVQEDWLATARAEGITPELDTRIAGFCAQAGGTVVCTCTTLGPTAERHGALRIDRPMMQAAARHGPRITMAYALASTLQPSLSLLRDCAGPQAALRPLDLTASWPLFETGDSDGFARSLAEGIRADLATHPADCIVLAQVSMAPAAARLGDLPCPVLSSPETALRSFLLPTP